jgi:hypothetical protein
MIMLSYYLVIIRLLSCYPGNVIMYHSKVIMLSYVFPLKTSHIVAPAPSLPNSMVPFLNES